MKVEVLSLAVGLGASVILLGMIAWSIAKPTRRLWPPLQSTRFKRVAVWLLTTTVFVTAFALGVADWNQLEWPAPVRWGVGLPLIILGNLVVWRGVFQLGMKATGGDVDTLVTDGLYQYSRNPQYVADMAILLGWQAFSASSLATPVVVAGLLVLALAPFAEESWLMATYGNVYHRYRSRTRRYL